MICVHCFWLKWYSSALSHQTTLARSLLEKPSKMSIPGSPSSNKHIMCFDTFGEDGKNASLLMLLRKFTSFSWCICQYIFISHKKYGTVSISSLAIRYEKVWRPKGLISETLSVTTPENEQMKPKQNKHHLPCLHAWIQFKFSRICLVERCHEDPVQKKHHESQEEKWGHQHIYCSFSASSFEAFFNLPFPGVFSLKIWYLW